MIRANLRKFLTFFMALAIVASPATSLINKALGGDGTHVHFDAISHQASEYLVSGHHHGDDDHGADESSLSHHDDGQAPHEAHFHFMTLAFTASFDLVAELPTSIYGMTIVSGQISRTYSPPARPPRAIS